MIKRCVWYSRASIRNNNIFGKESDWKCYMTIVIPDNQTALNVLVERYNREYVIISETEWKMYGNNGIMKISLIFAEEGGYYFLMR